MKLTTIGLTLIFILGCAAPEASIVSTDFVLPGEVDVTFQTLLPEGTARDEAIIFTLLDPLTGIEINPKSLQMTEEGGRSYSVRFSVSAGSMLSYRYARQGASQVVETTASGSAFEYRQFLVDGPGHVVTDLIAAWSDSIAAQETGGIIGVIQDMGTGIPLANIHITVSGIHTLSNSDGEFSIYDLPQGLHTILAYSENGDYTVFQQGALVAAGLETPADIKLQKIEKINVQFRVRAAENTVPGIPVYLISNLSGIARLTPTSVDEEGHLLYSAELPASTDIRYKYSLGDGFWNAEHEASGDYTVRQLYLDESMDGLVVEDQIATWEAGISAPIWFELSAPEGTGGEAYIQFKFASWTPAIRMWPLGDLHFAYKLNSPTNFAAPLEYRYCLDAFCLHAEDLEENRFATGNIDIVQYLEDQVKSWK